MMRIAPSFLLSVWLAGAARWLLRLAHPSLRRAAGVAFAATTVRLVHALSALLLTHVFGTGGDTDRYMAFTMVCVAVCTLSAIAVPTLAAAHWARVGPAQAVPQLRLWAQRLGTRFLAAYLLSVPLLSWWLTTPGDEHTHRAWQLGQLFLLATPCVYLSSQVAVEQAVLQARGRLLTTVWSGGWATLATASFLVLAAWQQDVRWGALGMAVGALSEWVWLRRCNRNLATRCRTAALEEQAPAVASFSLWGSLTFASLASFVVGPLDQVFLAALGPQSQAVWGLGSRIPSFLTLSLFAVVSVFSTAAAARWAEDAAQCARQGLRLAGAALVAGVLVLVLLYLNATACVKLLYERGAFSAQDTEATAHALQLSIWAYVLYPLSVALVRTAAAVRLQRTLLLSAGGFLALKVASLAILVPNWGLGGIGASTLVATGGQSAILAWALWSQIRPSTA